MHSRWTTFDCFGTLIDWNTGFSSLLTPQFGLQTAAVVHAYHQFERDLEAARPHRLYCDVLAGALTLAAKRVGVAISESEARRLPERWASLPLFADVENMLEDLRAMGCRLGVLTNCDDDLFARTERAFRRRFDLVVTSERVGAYKPSPAHFRHFSEITGVARRDWVHVACSWYHDIAPAHSLDLKCVWLDRDRTGHDERMASVRVESAADVSRLVGELFD
jgi:2-haloacid dehalogenase